jgi:hypothetical protein
MTEDTCKSCGAPILWVETEKGKAMPLDAAPEQRVMLVQTVAKGATKVKGVVVPCYRAHFATCPNADAHRKGKE